MTIERRTVSLRDCSFELIIEGDTFHGLGRVHIGGTLVRSGRLPLAPLSQTFDGREISRLRLLDVDVATDAVRIRTEAHFRRMTTRMMRDHSFDPIHDTTDWGAEAGADAGTARLDIVLRPASDSFGGVAFSGFSYHYEYQSENAPIYWLLDRASWEIGGDITGATVFNQSSCSAPVVTFARDTEWTSEGIIHWNDPHSKANPVMTHNLPRWASHQAFDFQCTGDAILLGVYERVDLIRSLLRREAERPELKTFDKHIFDQTTSYATSPKAILLKKGATTSTQRENIWTWVFDAVADRARAEFGLAEEPMLPRIGMNYWVNWSIDKYYQDLLPAAKATGIKSLFIDNVNRSDYTEYNGYPDGWRNMCQGHQYEPGANIGGCDALRAFTDECRKHGIRPFSWTNNDQSILSPLYNKHDWFVRMEDTRLKYGGAYTNTFAIWNPCHDEPLRYWIDCLKKIKTETGLDAYLFDSFYNLGFMPVDYSDCTPRTQWRQLLAAFKELQDFGISFMIESFGPFGEVQHGCPTSYCVENMFACYKIGLGNNYTTIPTGQEKAEQSLWPTDMYYRILAHMTKPAHPLFFGKTRLDALFTEAHRRALADYYANLPQMRHRILQENGQGVVWHNADATRATIWNFTDRKASLPGTIIDLSTNAPLPRAAEYELESGNTYAVTDYDGNAPSQV